MSVATATIGTYQKKEKLMPSEARKYTLVEYTFAGQRVVSAIHHLDLWKFLAENKDARIIKK